MPAPPEIREPVLRGIVIRPLDVLRDFEAWKLRLAPLTVSVNAVPKNLPSNITNGSRSN